MVQSKKKNSVVKNADKISKPVENFIAKNNKPEDNSKLKCRVKSAVILGAIVATVFAIGNPLVSGMFVLMGMIMLVEWDKMFNKNANFIGTGMSIFFFINNIIYSCAMACLYFSDNYIISLMVLVVGFILSMFILILTGKDRFILESVPSLYISGAMLATLYMYNRFGILVLGFLFVITVATDTCAYFVGCHFRGRKLAPTISPNKSISGAIGGIAGAFIFACLYLLILFWFGKVDIISHLYLFGLIAIILSILSQCGDLFESYCKRICDIKDSGNLIQGHGGLLDRFDSFIAIVPIYVIMIVLSQSLL